MREQCGRCVQEVKECMNSVRVCTGDKEITKSHKMALQTNLKVQHQFQRSC